MQSHKTHGLECQWAAFGILLSKVECEEMYRRVGNLWAYFPCKADLFDFVSHFQSIDIVII